MAEKRSDGAGSALAATSERFVDEVERQFGTQLSTDVAFDDYQRQLARNMFVKVDMALAAAEARRSNDSRKPYTWSNVDMQALALDTVHRVNLGLDALIPNHISPIPRWNSRKKMYGVDLQIGYVGKDYVRRKAAVDEFVDVVYHLVHETDHFRPLPRSADRDHDEYEFEIKDPWNRGQVVGGFGYIVFDNPAKNRLVLVTPRDFKRAEKSSGTDDFWGEGKHRQEMQYKTVVHRVTDRIPIDPAKIHSHSFGYVEAQEVRALGPATDADLEAELAQAADAQEVDVEAPEVVGAGQPQGRGEEAAQGADQGRQEKEQAADPADSLTPFQRFEQLCEAEGLVVAKARDLVAMREGKSTSDLHSTDYARVVEEPDEREDFLKEYRALDEEVRQADMQGAGAAPAAEPQEGGAGEGEQGQLGGVPDW